MVSYLQKRIQSLVNLGRRAKAALTRKVVGVYLLWTLLAAVGSETALYFFAPADVPTKCATSLLKS